MIWAVVGDATRRPATTGRVEQVGKAVVHFAVRMPAEVDEAIGTLADTHGLSRNAAIVQALREYIANHSIYLIVHGKVGKI